jgi:autotransporter-associated beta strand protein
VFSVVAGSTLQGSSASLAGPISNSGAVVFDQSTTGTFANTIAGTGALTKQNSGALTLSGNVAAASTTVTGGSLIVTGAVASPVTVASGGTLQIGAGAAAGAVQGAVTDNGVVTFDRTDNVTFSSAFSGDGALVDDDPAVLTFGGPYSFTGVTTINGGGSIDIAQLAANTNIDLTSGNLNLTGTSSSIGVLSGTGGTINIGAGDTLTVSSGDFSGAIDGAGALTKASSGLLILGGTVNIGGPTNVAGGTLEIDGSFTSPTVEVGSGAALGGDGTIHGAVSVDAGGVYSPGDPVTSTVVGSVTFKTGSTYLAQVTGAGAHDLIQVTGPVTIQSGAAVEAQPLGAVSTYARLNSYQVVTATGGLTGTFSSVTSDMPLLTPVLSYSANAVTLTLARNDIAFSSLAATQNQASVATAVQAGGMTSPLFLALVAQSTPGAQAGYDALSGEIYADLSSLTFSDSDQTRRTLLQRLDQTGHNGLWAEGTGDWTQAGDQGGVAGASANSGGATVGLDGDFGGWRLGIAGGYSQQDLTVEARASTAQDDAETVSLYAGTNAGPWVARIGGGYAWRQLSASRDELFPGFADHTGSRFDATSAQAFGDLGYQLKTANGAYGPFAGVAYDELTTPSFRESGGASALAVSGGSDSAVALRLGLRGAAELGATDGATFSLHASAAWRYEAGALASTDQMRFVGTGQGFDVSGLALARNAADVSAGVTARLGPHLKVDLSYAGTLAPRWQDNAVKLLAAWTF